MKKLIVLWIFLLAASISCSSGKSQPQTTTAQTSQTEAKQLNEHDNDILDRVETFYNNRMTQLLWVMGVGFAIIGVIFPIIQESQRQRSFEKEMANRLQKFKETLLDTLKNYTKEEMRKLDKVVSQNFSMLYSGIGGILSSQGAYELMLQTNVLAMMNHIDSDCSGACLSSSDIIRLLSDKDRIKKIGIDALDLADSLIEGNKKALDMITDTEKREDMKSQVRELQIFIHQLIHNKQQTPPQSSPQ